jgi:hypothetical protein
MGNYAGNYAGIRGDYAGIWGIMPEIMPEFWAIMPEFTRLCRKYAHKRVCTRTGRISITSWLA